MNAPCRSDLTQRPTDPIRPELEEGLALYRAGFFWEAHEAWEPLWLAALPNSRERALLQGLIQLANGWLKQRLGRARAALRIAALAEAHLARAGQGAVLGLDSVWVQAELARLKAAANLLEEKVQDNA
jgi:hypothetical protein